MAPELRKTAPELSRCEGIGWVGILDLCRSLFVVFGLEVGLVLISELKRILGMGRCTLRRRRIRPRHLRHRQRGIRILLRQRTRGIHIRLRHCTRDIRTRPLGRQGIRTRLRRSSTAGDIKDISIMDLRLLHLPTTFTIVITMMVPPFSKAVLRPFVAVAYWKNAASE
ncbi:hypothetical protein SASPL_106749 [Salvia splendens]|uniref:Uncharacterized protein n=1 Tax=Salvia splendens TaxID=180675 RepID=A0A8X8YLH8_SALSN|nr:hypothetical protein SASPL_106749 [Salvia splendens]